MKYSMRIEKGPTDDVGRSCLDRQAFLDFIVLRTFVETRENDSYLGGTTAVS